MNNADSVAVIKAPPFSRTFANDGAGRDGSSRQVLSPLTDMTWSDNLGSRFALRPVDDEDSQLAARGTCTLGLVPDEDAPDQDAQVLLSRWFLPGTFSSTDGLADHISARRSDWPDAWLVGGRRFNIWAELDRSSASSPRAERLDNGSAPHQAERSPPDPGGSLGPRADAPQPAEPAAQGTELRLHMNAEALKVCLEHFCSEQKLLDFLNIRLIRRICSRFLKRWFKGGAALGPQPSYEAVLPPGPLLEFSQLDPPQPPAGSGSHGGWKSLQGVLVAPPANPSDAGLVHAESDRSTAKSDASDPREGMQSPPPEAPKADPNCRDQGPLPHATEPVLAATLDDVLVSSVSGYVQRRLLRALNGKGNVLISRVLYAVYGSEDKRNLEALLKAKDRLNANLAERRERCAVCQEGETLILAPL
jgi:hypothetical protein